MLSYESDIFPRVYVITFLIICLPIISDCFSGFPFAGWICFTEARLVYLFDWFYFQTFSRGIGLIISIAGSRFLVIASAGFHILLQDPMFSQSNFFDCFRCLLASKLAFWLSKLNVYSFFWCWSRQVYPYQPRLIIYQSWFLSIPVLCLAPLVVIPSRYFCISTCLSFRLLLLRRNKFRLVISNVNPVCDLFSTFRSEDFLVFYRLFFKLHYRGNAITFWSFVFHIVSTSTEVLVFSMLRVVQFFLLFTVSSFTTVLFFVSHRGDLLFNTLITYRFCNLHCFGDNLLPWQLFFPFRWFIKRFKEHFAAVRFWFFFN